MANDTKSLTLRIKGDTENARREFSLLLKDLKGVDTGVLGVGKNFKAFGAILGGVGVGAVLGTIAAATRAVVTAASEAERVQGKLNAVLKATGEAAGLTAAELGAMADELARSTQFDDEQIKEAMTVLLAFPGVGREVFGDAIRLATDLSVVMGGDLSGAARNVGRALQDPVGGLRTLKTELGVNTDALGDHNEALIKSGNLLGAQKNVIGELESRLGGAAAGANTGLYGATKSTAKAWNELLEEIGRTPEIGAGAQASLVSLTGILNALNAELKERNENVLRSLGVLPAPRPIELPGLQKPGENDPNFIRLIPKGLTREQFEARSRGFEAQKAAQEAATAELRKKASEEFKKALTDLEKRIALLGQEQAAEQILFEVQQGRYQDLAQNEKAALLAAAQRLDAAKEAQDFENEATADLQRQIAVEHEYNAELEKSAEALRDAIDPARALFAEMTKIDDLFARGKITADEFIDGMLEVQGRLNELGQDTKKAADEMTEFAKEAARGMQSAFAEEFFNIFEGKVDNLGESFVRLLHRMAAELASSELMKFLTGDFGKTGQVGGFLGSLFASTAHAGGLVGSGLPGRYVPALAFANPQILHGGGVAGLRDDEVPTILRKGEMVLTPEQMRAGGAGEVKVMIENRGTPQQVTESQATINPDGIVVKVVVDDVARGGPISGSLARAFNLRRS